MSLQELAYFELMSTRSELGLPFKGERIEGVNVKSNQVDAFSEADERLLVTVAGQLVTFFIKCLNYWQPSK